MIGGPHHRLVRRHFTSRSGTCHDLDHRQTDLDLVAGLEPRHGRDPRSVDPRAVEGAEILDLERSVDGLDPRVAARQLEIFDREVSVLASDDELRVDLERPTARWAV